jgi:hypothetical protein
VAASGVFLLAAAPTQDQAAGLGIRSDWNDSLTVYFSISVKTYQDPDKDLNAYKTFSFDYASQNDPLLEKELFRELQSQLDARGLKRHDANPQMVIRMLFTVQPGPENTFVRYLQLNFLDGPELTSGKELKVPPVVWKGEAGSGGTASDIRKVAPFMFRELLGEFPTRTGKNEKRPWICGNIAEIGIEVDRKDWHVIRAVQPGSPAALAGVRVSDSLEKINDATTSWRMSYRPEREKYRFQRENWVQRDYLYIRYSKEIGNQMVLKLKGADRKTRTVRVPFAVSERCGPAGDS